MIHRISLIWKAALVLASLSCAFSNAHAQKLDDLLKARQDPAAAYRGVAAGLGTSTIDGKTYFLIHLAPQIPIGKFVIGLDGNLRFDENGKLRRADWDETYDYARLINFISYGQQHDDFYARLGGLDRASIGDGTIVDNYSNNSSYDDRRIGIGSRVDVGPFGGEVLIGDMFAAGLRAVRPFIHPFQLTPLHGVWLLSDIEVGATWAADFDSNARRIIPNRPPYVIRDPNDSTKVIINEEEGHLNGPLTTYGVDLGMYLLRGNNYEARVYGDYIKFAQFNHGFIFGGHLDYTKDSSFLFDFRLERSLFQNHFLPNYYNSFYERDRFDNTVEEDDFITKTTLLADTTSGNGNGFRGGVILGLGKLIVGEVQYSHLDNLRGHDLLDTYVTFPDLGYDFFGAFSYSRKDILGINDLFALDARSLMKAKLSWRPVDFLIGSAIFRWTFNRDDNGVLHTQSFIEPKVDFIFKL